MDIHTIASKIRNLEWSKADTHKVDAVEREIRGLKEELQRATNNLSSAEYTIQRLEERVAALERGPEA